MLCPKCNKEIGGEVKLPDAATATQVRVAVLKCPFCNTEYTTYKYEEAD